MKCITIKGIHGSDIKHCSTVESNLKEHKKNYKRRQTEKPKQWCAKSVSNKGGSRTYDQWGD